MNADQLLTHYDRIADAPDAVARLRRFILDLSVRGKLVFQDPNDEPASRLLEKIAAEKSQKASKKIVVSSVRKQDLPFTLPIRWEWVNLGDILLKLTDGTHHSPPNESLGDFKYITAKNIKNNGVSLTDVTYVSRLVHEEIFSRCNPEKGDILYIKDGATTGVVTINDLEEPFSMLSSVALLKLPTCLFNQLIVVFLRSPFFYDQMRDFMKGAAIPRVTLKRMAPALVPLPPLAEQHRIVAKVDELMALCDQLEASRAEREATRDRLAASSLARLNAPDPDTFQDDARFALGALPALTTRPDQIKQLRQTILNLAVRGKLVPQDPNDEPASELLKRIAFEKDRLTKLRQIKVDKASEPIKLIGEIVPKGWVLCRWNTIAKKIGDIDHKMPDTVSEGVPYVSPRDFRPNNVIEFDNAKKVSREDYLRLSAKIRPEFNDLIYPRYGTIGENRLVTDEREFLVSYSCAVVKTLIGFINPSYQFIFSVSSFCKDQAKAAENKTTQANVGIASIQQYVVPLPPIAEQDRIVAKVDELMALCDQLEASLRDSGDTTGRLLEALLAEALAPVESREFAELATV